MGFFSFRSWKPSLSSWTQFVQTQLTGNTTARMVIENSDSFIDPADWPDAEERDHLARIFGWDGDEIVGRGARATHALRKAR
jgi:hypothetical protein